MLRKRGSQLLRKILKMVGCCWSVVGGWSLLDRGLRNSYMQQHVVAAVAFRLSKVLQWKMRPAILHLSAIAFDGKVWPRLHLPQVKTTKVPDAPLNMRELLPRAAASERAHAVCVCAVR